MSEQAVDKKQTMKENVITKKLWLILLTILPILVIYSFSLNREWQLFDEKGMYVDEKLFPTSNSISELFEVISTYALSYNIDSQNAFFSNIVSVRSNLLGAILNILTQFLFSNNALYYHILQLCLHLLNTVLVWFILYIVFKYFKCENNFLISLLTIIWAIHPANTEATLLVTNWTSLVNYTFCFGFFLYLLKKVLSDDLKYSKIETIIISILFFLSILIVEYSYALPFVLFFVFLSFTLKKSLSLQKSFLQSISLSVPFLFGLLFYMIYQLFRAQIIIKDLSLISQINNFSIERLLWLSPQIFTYFFKLLFFPIALTLYQTCLMPLGNSLFTPYAIFSIITTLVLVALPVLLFLRSTASPQKSYLFLLPYSFFFSLFPFLHIISPTYCLISDRYCYFPLFVLLFLLTVLISELGLDKHKKAITILLFAVLLPLSVLTFLRIKDWKDSFSLYSSSLKCTSDKLFKGKIYSVLGYYFEKVQDTENMKKYLLLSIKNLEAGIQELELKKVKHPFPSKILKDYGLDIDSQITTSAFVIAQTKLSNFQEPVGKVLEYYEPFVKTNLLKAGNSQIDFYAKLLIKTNKLKEAQEVLEIAYKKYPFSPAIIYTLSNLHLRNKDIINATRIIEEGYKLYPSYHRILTRKIKLLELKNDPIELANYEYLLGLRAHSIKAYQKASQLYLFSNKLPKAKKILDKLLFFDKSNPVSLLLLSKYYYLNGKKDLIIPTLTEAYINAKKTSPGIDLPVLKSILLSLVSFNVSSGNTPDIQKYVSELEQIGLEKTEKAYIDAIKKKLRLV